MPTTTVTLGRERSIATLARRVYRIEGPASAELQRRAEAALLAANPRLTSAESFRRGNPIVVPAVPGLNRTDEVSTADADADGLTVETTLRLQALGSRVEDRFRRASEERRQTLERLDDARFLAEARAALPESVERLSEARDEMNRREQQDAEVSERFRDAVAAALEGVKAIDALVRKTRPR